MCGIIGINSLTPVAERIIAGLQRLEYRGYDSAGLAVIDDSGALVRCRAAGKLAALLTQYQQAPIEGHIGIGHTRWATHGLASDANAHPHGTDTIAVVHNGIIENFPALKAELNAQNHQLDWESETDTEVIVHLFAHLLAQCRDPAAAMQQLLTKLEGAFALAILLKDHHQLMLVARRGSPLAIAYGQNETLVGSDAMALAGLTSQVCYLNDGEWAVLEKQKIHLFDANNTLVNPVWHTMPQTQKRFQKGNYPHAMLREIHEQPSVIGDTLNSLINPKTLHMSGDENYAERYIKASMIQFCACGTAFYATQVAAYWFEALCRLPVRNDIASELRYRHVVALPEALGIFVSQSGETMDTMQAMQHWQSLGATASCIVNVPQSSLARAANHTIHTLAGPEIGVASTKGFTTQLTALYCLAVWMAKQRGHLSEAQMQNMVKDLLELPAKITQCLKMIPMYQQVARDVLSTATGVFFLGRGNLYPLALEGALKLKEITYQHAEGYAAGEMKHGPIALVSEQLPVVFLAPHDSLISKTMSNIKEIASRGGRVIMLSDQQGIDLAFEQGLHDSIIPLLMPTVSELLQPILYAIPMQMLAYETAAVMGREIDQPRNLAKSVTVE